MKVSKEVIFKNIWYLIITIIFFSLFLKLNRLTLFTSDDFTYHYVYKGYMPGRYPERVHGFFSLIQSQINHWRLWNGRFVAHTIVQFFLQSDKGYYDIFNSAAIVLLNTIVLSLSLINSNKEIKPFTYLLGFIFIWFFLPDIGNSVLWVSGSGNYLWTSLIYLSYFYLAIKLASKPTLVNWKFQLPIVFLGFLAGACNENSSPTILLLIFIFQLGHYLFQKDWNWIVFSSLIFGGLGFILMMSSPGSQKRGSIKHTASFLHNNYEQIANLLKYNYHWLYYTLALLIILIIIMRIRIDKEHFLFFVILALGHVISAYVLVLSPEIHKRTLFSSVLFLGILLFALFNILSEKLFKPILYALTLITSITFLFSYSDVHKNIKSTYNELMIQNEILEKAPSESDVSIPILTPPNNEYNAYNSSQYVTPFPKQWFNRWMSVYYGKNSITGVDMDEYNKERANDSTK